MKTLTIGSAVAGRHAQFRVPADFVTETAYPIRLSEELAG